MLRELFERFFRLFRFSLRILRARSYPVLLQPSKHFAAQVTIIPADSERRQAMIVDQIPDFGPGQVHEFHQLTRIQ